MSVSEMRRKVEMARARRAAQFALEVEQAAAEQAAAEPPMTAELPVAAESPVAAEPPVVQEAVNEKVYSPRQRAVTVGPSLSERRAKLAARRLSGDCGGATSVAEVRRKIEMVRARRAERLALEAEQAAAEQAAEQAAAEQAATEPVMPVSLSASPSVSPAEFQEIAMPVRDIEWQKRIYYHYAAQENEDFRRLSEPVEIRDCRAECLEDLLGPDAQVPDASIGHVADSEVDAVADWLDEDDDDVSDGFDAASFDWSRAGFGYIEFGSPSRTSLDAVSTVSSHHRTEGVVTFAEPPVRPDAVPVEPVELVEPQPVCPDAVPVAEIPRRRALMLAGLGLPPINERDAEEARCSANAQSAGDRALAMERLLALRRESARLQDDVRRAEKAVRAMHKLYAVSLAVQPMAA
ncbi:hypothetical protein LPJ73_006031 [Coemansia sp. RSA 2703]|nr:hypothetical protein LPJ73_006031 [Coemansia sp. RSA 2703]